MRIGIIGAGNIGGNVARRLAVAGHDVTVSFARDQAALAAFADQIGATVGEPSRAAAADVVVLSVPWGVIDTALAAAGPLTGKVVVDTTNQFGPGGAIDLGHTAARHNADRMPGARYTKCFNTLTSASRRRRQTVPATRGSCSGSAETTTRPRRSSASLSATPVMFQPTSAASTSAR